MGTDIFADDESAARRLALSLSPPVAWPLLGFAAAMPVMHLAILWLAVGGLLPVWVVTAPLAISAYLHYTIVHEAIHRNIAPGWRGFARVNTALGWWGSVVLGSTWPLFRRTHIAHHAHTNTERDADLFVRGPLIRLFGLWMVALVANLIPVKPLKWLFDRIGFDIGYLDAAPLMPAREWRRHLQAHAALCAFVWTGVLLGHGEAMFAIYVLPAALGRLLVGVLLAWLPHAPFTDTGRYRDTRVKRFPLSRLILCGQDLHLIHHLYPSVPVHNYPRLFRAIEPDLRARGARVDR